MPSLIVIIYIEHGFSQFIPVFIAAISHSHSLGGSSVVLKEHVIEMRMATLVVPLAAE